jgi:outer membrane protein assembly factor BamB
VSVLSGSVGVFGEGGELELRSGQMAALRPGQPAEVASHIDPRTFALDFVPAPLRRSAWPVKGGSAARSGWSPFLLAGPPVQAASLDGVVGASAVVLGGDGTGYFLAGPPPGRLAAVDLGPVRKAVVVASFPSPFAGDPALGPDGRIYACTRDGAVLAFDPGARTEGLVTVVAASSGSIPRTGPTLGPDGSICVVYANGLAAHSGEGNLRWRRNDIAAGAPPSIGPDGTVFAASLGGRLHVLDPATGRDLAGEELSAREAFLSHVAVALDGTAYAVSARGKLLWRSPEGEFEKVALPEADYPLAPAVGGGGEVIVVSSGGTVYRMRARPTAPPGAPFFEAGEPVRQGPLVDGAGRVLLLTRSGTLVTVDPTRRSRPAELGARGASPPAITRHGGLVIVTRDGRVFAGKRRAGEGR